MKDCEKLTPKMYPDQIKLRDDYVKTINKTKEYIIMAAQAIAVHNIKKECSEDEALGLNRKGVTIGELLIPLKDEPIAYLLRLCDELQCWDRRYSVSALDVVAPLDAEKIKISNNAGIISISIMDKKTLEGIRRALENTIDPGVNQCIDIID